MATPWSQLFRSTRPLTFDVGSFAAYIAKPELPDLERTTVTVTKDGVVSLSDVTGATAGYNIWESAFHAVKDLTDKIDRIAHRMANHGQTMPVFSQALYASTVQQVAGSGIVALQNALTFFHTVLGVPCWECLYQLYRGPCSVMCWPAFTVVDGRVTLSPQNLDHFSEVWIGLSTPDSLMTAINSNKYPLPKRSSPSAMVVLDTYSQHLGAIKREVALTTAYNVYRVTVSQTNYYSDKLFKDRLFVLPTAKGFLPDNVMQQCQVRFASGACSADDDAVKTFDDVVNILPSTFCFRWNDAWVNGVYIPTIADPTIFLFDNGKPSVSALIQACVITRTYGALLASLQTAPVTTTLQISREQKYHMTLEACAYDANLKPLSEGNVATAMSCFVEQLFLNRDYATHWRLTPFSDPHSVRVYWQATQHGHVHVYSPHGFKVRNALARKSLPRHVYIFRRRCSPGQKYHLPSRQHS